LITDNFNLALHVVPKEAVEAEAEAEDADYFQKKEEDSISTSP
jgi:hypothetical protein